MTTQQAIILGSLIIASGMFSIAMQIYELVKQLAKGNDHARNK